MFVSLAMLAPVAIVLAGAGGKARGKSAPSKADSPGQRKKKGEPKKGNTKANGQTFALKVAAFHPILSMEACLHERSDDEDGFLNDIREFTEDKQDVPILEELGIARVVPRRIPNAHGDIVVGGKKGFWRNVIIRCLDEEPPTPESRQEGLEKLRLFFLDPKHAKCPPPSINAADLANEGEPASLGHCFVDEDIKAIVEEDIQEEALVSTFFQKHPELARQCWSGTHISTWASTLGFPAS